MTHLVSTLGPVTRTGNIRLKRRNSGNGPVSVLSCVIRTQKYFEFGDGNNN